MIHRTLTLASTSLSAKFAFNKKSKKSHKKLSSILVTLFLLTTNAYGDSSYSDQVYENLDRMDRIERKAELFTFLDNNQKNISSRQQAIPYIEWLRDKAYEDGSTFRYATMYSFYLMSAGYKEAAEIMLVSGMIQLYIDHARCENRRASMSKFTGWNRGMLGSGILNNLKSKTKKENKKILKTALKIEKEHKKRKGDVWLCSSINWTKAFSQMEKLKTEDVTGTGHLGKTISVTATKDILVPAKFILDKEWKKVRKKRLKEFKAQFYKEYY